MRIAWLGPVGEDGGAGGLGALLMEGVLECGAEVEFFTEEGVKVPDALSAHKNLTVVRLSSWWRWGKWYSKHSMTAFASGMAARSQVHSRICDMILERHRSNPYDCIFQFSQAELLKLARHTDELPPIAIYPCSHAAGELRWHRRESAYALKSERRVIHYAVRLMLRFRAAVQRRQMQKAAMILGPSNRFNELVSADYGVPLDRFRVLYHPIRDAGDGFLQLQDSATPPSPMKILFVGRISVRKGFEQIVELSHRLDDAFGQIEIHIIGDKTQWSDYTGHIKDLNGRIARFVGSVKHREMSSLYDSADILLVPSMYEPGPLVLGEALSRGVSVIASDEVGSAEPLSHNCCRRFPAGSVDALEASVRQLINDIRADRSTLRRLAHQEAKQHFAPEVISEQLLSCLREVASVKRPLTAGARQIDLSIS